MALITSDYGSIRRAAVGWGGGAIPFIPDPRDISHLELGPICLLRATQACLWSEYANDANVAGRLFPRLAAVAERLWGLPKSGERILVVSFHRLLLCFHCL